jgi:hypothetical protein
MQAFTGWIREHVEDIELGFWADILSPEALILLPKFLPFSLGGARVVSRHLQSSSIEQKSISRFGFHLKRE